MSNKNYQYEYIDKESINSELFCIICKDPFVEPISTQCDHTFCRNCLKEWIEKQNKSCPTCRQQIKSIDQCLQVSRPLRNMLDHLQIKCLICEQTNIHRGNFTDHINKICPKIEVTCSAADIKCTWKGLREDFQNHLIICKFEPLRSLLVQLINENQQLNNEKQKLTDQIKQHNIQINELTNKLSTITNQNLLLEKLNEDVLNLTVDYSQQKLTDHDLLNLIPQIQNKNFKILQLQGNTITSQGILILLDILLENSSILEDLWLSNNCISDLGIQILTRTYLSNNSILKQLHLGSNCITDRGIQYLIDLLKSNNTITDLWLYNNQITDQGVLNLTSILKTTNRTLKHLDIQWNKLITDTSINSIINMLESNRIIERINLRKCNLSITGKIKICQAIVDRKDFKLII